MLIDRAVFRLEEVEEIVTLDNIVQHGDYVTVRDNLYCPTPNCNCRLIYIPQGRKIAYFKKWNGDNHNENCQFYKETTNNGHSRRILGSNTSILRDSHVTDILRGIYDTYTETDEEKNARLTRQREYARKRRNRRINAEERNPIEEVIVNQPTTSLDGESLTEGERNPPVRRRISVLDFDIEDIGNTEATIGTITEIQNNDRQTIITISDKLERGDFNIYLEEVFFRNSPLNINRLLTVLERIIESGREVIVSCVGEVIQRNEEIGMLVLNENRLRFNRVPLSSLIIHSNLDQ